MKYIAKFLFLMIAVGFVSSCSDEFLDKQPTELISATTMGEVSKYNPDIFNGQVSGLYTLMYQTGTGGTDLDHDDFGQRGYDIYSDMLSGDMALSGYNYGWYSDVAKFNTTIDNTLNGNYKPWRYYYRIIFAANTVIDGLGGNDVVPVLETEMFQMGQAKGMRAYAYMYLMYLYNEDINNLAAPAIPLYTSAEEQSLPQSTGQEVWNSIKSDLQSAVTLLDGFVPAGQQAMSQDVAKGLLTYTYVTLDEYTSAVTVADELIASYDIIPLALVAGGGSIPRNAYSYIDGEGADWIWGMDLTLDQGLDLVSWWGQCDIFTYSYAYVGDPKTMDMGLFNSIRVTDERKYQFIDPWGEGFNYPANKFYDQNRTGFYQREVTSDYVYMRVEEIHLLKAEALYFAGNEPGARTALTVLVSERDTDPSYLATLSGTALRDEIYKQWRIEMWGEGKSYLAMKRFEATIVREGHIDYDGVAIPYNDTRLTFEIPYQEIQDNINISE
jgi:hypothetical protein